MESFSFTLARYLARTSSQGLRSDGKKQNFRGLKIGH